MFERLRSSGELGLPPTRSCSDQELIDALGEAARREAMCAERKLAYATELHRRRVRQDEADGVSCAYRGRGTIAEIAAALTVGRGTAAVLLHLGCELGGRLPATGAALAAGDIDVSRARIISDATLTLHDEHAALVEHRVLPRLIGRNAGQARRILTDTITRVDPAAASTRRVLAERDRDVTVQPADDGMSTLWATLPAADALTLDTQLGAMATGVCTQDPRTLGQRRADALVALAHHETGLRCACGNTCYTHHAPPRPPALIRVITDASTLLRLTDTPGHLDGYGTIDPDLTRRLATDATWQQLLTAPTPGGTPSPSGSAPHAPPGSYPQPPPQPP